MSLSWIWKRGPCYCYLDCTWLLLFAQAPRALPSVASSHAASLATDTVELNITSVDDDTLVKVSGAGKDAMDELFNQTQNIYANKNIEKNKFTKLS